MLMARGPVVVLDAWMKDNSATQCYDLVESGAIVLGWYNPEQDRADKLDNLCANYNVVSTACTYCVL